MANEIENKSTFADSKPEPTESERIIKRIQNFRVGITPDQATSVSQILEKGLSAGLFKLSELKTIVSVNEELNKGVIDYNSQVKVAQQRLNELQEEELVAKQVELARRETERHDELAGERQRRKKAEDEVRILKAQLEALSGVAGNVTSAPVSVEQPHAPLKSDKPKSKAWEMIRAGRSEPEEVKSEDFITELKEEDIADLGQDLPVVLDVPEDAKGISEFFEEVETVQELADVADKLVDEHTELTRREQVLLDPLTASQKEESEFKFVEEDEKTKPTFSGPKITGGNAPNIKAVVEQPKNVEAKVDKPIRQYDSEEELLADAKRRAEERKAKQEAEEEFEEVTIPSESELRAMTKNEIQNIAQTLGFTSVVSTLTKEKMVETFLSETEEFIQSLQDSGEFVSATDTDTEKTKDGDDIRDGGYF